MKKVICCNNTGFPLQVPCKVLVPGEPAEIEVNDWQLKKLQQDPRITFYEEMPKPKKSTKAKSSGGDGSPLIPQPMKGASPNPARMRRPSPTSPRRSQGQDQEEELVDGRLHRTGRR